MVSLLKMMTRPLKASADRLVVAPTATDEATTFAVVLPLPTTPDAVVSASAFVRNSVDTSSANLAAALAGFPSYA